MPVPVDPEVVPSGSIPNNPEFADPAAVDQSGQLPGDGGDGTKFIDPEIEEDDKDADAPKSGDTATKTPEELAAMVERSQEFIGKQSTEIGALRKKLEELESSVQKGQPQGQQEPDVEPEEALRGVLGKFTAGEATIEDVVMQAFQAGTKQADKIAEGKFAERDNAARTNAAHQAYLEKNPDFAEKFQSGKVQEIQQQNPLYNEVSAFESLKRGEAEAQVVELTKQIEAMKAERESSIAAGRAPAGKVINTPGSSASAIGAAPNSNDVRAAMLEGVRAARAAG